MFGALTSQHPTIQKIKAIRARKKRFQGIDFLVGGIWVADADHTAAEEVSYMLSGAFLEATTFYLSGDDTKRLLGVLGADPQNGLLKLWTFDSATEYTEASQILPAGESVDTKRSAWDFKGFTVTQGGTLEWTLRLIKHARNHLTVTTNTLKPEPTTATVSYHRIRA